MLFEKIRLLQSEVLSELLDEQPGLCMETREVISPNCVNRNYRKGCRLVHLFLKNPREAFRAVRRHLSI